MVPFKRKVDWAEYSIPLRNCQATPLRLAVTLGGCPPVNGDCGIGDTCKAGDLEMTAGEDGKLLQPSDFPFTTADQVAEVILTRAGL